MAISRREMLKRVASTGAVLAAGPGRATASESKPTPRADAVALLFDATRCVGCKTCMVACKEENGLRSDDRTPGMALYDAPTDLNDRTPTIIKMASTDLGPAFVKKQCMHCLDPACASACMLGALEKSRFGAVTWDSDYCVGCRYCQIACPFNIPKFEWESANPRIVKCDMCQARLDQDELPACVAVCPRGGIEAGPYDAMLAEAQRRIETDPDRYVPGIYGDTEVGGTQVLYLSHVPFETLGLVLNDETPVPQLQRAIQHGLYQGFVAPAVLYGALVGVLWKNGRTEDGKVVPAESDRDSHKAMAGPEDPTQEPDLWEDALDPDQPPVEVGGPAAGGAGSWPEREVEP